MEFDIYNILLVCYFIILITGIVKGSGENRSIIVFRNYDDLGLTFLIPVSFILISYIFISMGGNQILGVSVGAIVALGLFIKLVIITYEDNNNSLSTTILVLLTKIPLGIIWIMNLMQVLNPDGKGSQRSENRGHALIMLTFLTPIIGLLVVDKSGSYFNPKGWLAGRRVGSSVRNHI
jgi:hypothetical protein